jgi:phosphatidylcholine synthase
MQRGADEPGPGDGVGNPVRRASAFAVHVFTASGAALGLLALIAAVDRNWTLMFVWLGAALIVDGVDGTIARYARVAELLPRWSGDILDFVVDFLTYVVVPAYAIVASGLLPAPAAIPAGIAIVVTSALYFADRNMKMADNCFRGFPAVWNVAAFYLFIVRPDPWVAAAAVAALVVLTFMPLPFVHPLRVKRLRLVNIVLLILWSLLAVLALVHSLQPEPWITATLCAIALYFLVAGLVRRVQ